MIKKILLGFLAGFLVMVGVLTYRGDLQRLMRTWFQEKILKELVARLNKELPFEIEELFIDTDWDSLKQGKLSKVRVTLKKLPIRLRLEGPLQIQNHTLLFASDSYLEGVPDTKPIGFDLDLSVSLADQYKKITRVSLEAELPGHIWAKVIETKKGTAEAIWNVEDPIARASFVLDEAQWTQSSDHVLQLKKARLNVELPLTIQPFSYQFPAHAELKMEHLEALWDALYLDLDLKKFRVQTTYAPDAVHALLKEGEKKRLEIDSKPNGNIKVALTKSPLAPLWKVGVKAYPALSKLEGIDVRTGTLEGHLDYQPQNQQARGSLDLQNLTALWAENELAAKNLNLKIPHLSFNGFEGKIDVEKIVFKKFSAKLASSKIQMAREKETFRASLGDRGQWLPLQLSDLPFRVGSLSGLLQGDETEIESKAELQSIPLQDVMKHMCVPFKSLPPTPVEFQFPLWSFGPGFVDLTGKIKARLFEGEIEIDEMGFFDLGSPVSEFDFSTRWKGLRLDKIGEHIGFGEMDGTLDGYAEDVVFQSWLPTQFDLKVEVNPMHHRKIVFSPDAMKNVVRIFAGDGLEQMPGIAHWVAFGWPSRFLGGYDVHYAGISAFSHEGSILLETHDPKRVLDRERKHFILYGPRFKMPLNSSRYPLVVDATSMVNFIRKLKDQLALIAAEKTTEKENEKRLKEGQSPETPIYAETTDAEKIDDEKIPCFDPGF